MRNWLHYVGVGGAVVAFAVGASVNGQDAERSRLLPPPVPNSPPMIRTAPQVLRPTSPAKMPKFATPDQFAGIVQACTDIVTPEFDVDTSSLRKSGWGHTEPQRGQGAEGTFEKVEYHNNDKTIALLDFGNMVVCRSIAFVQSPKQFGEVRRAVIENLRAKPLRAVPELKDLSKLIAQQGPKTNQDNVLVSGVYQIELTSHTLTAAQHGQAGAPDIGMVMATTVPLPPRFRSYQQNR